MQETQLTMSPSYKASGQDKTDKHTDLEPVWSYLFFSHFFTAHTAHTSAVLEWPYSLSPPEIYICYFSPPVPLSPQFFPSHLHPPTSTIAWLVLLELQQPFLMCLLLTWPVHDMCPTCASHLSHGLYRQLTPLDLHSKLLKKELHCISLWLRRTRTMSGMKQQLNVYLMREWVHDWLNGWMNKCMNAQLKNPVCTRWREKCQNCEKTLNHCCGAETLELTNNGTNWSVPRNLMVETRSHGWE